MLEVLVKNQDSKRRQKGKEWEKGRKAKGLTWILPPNPDRRPESLPMDPTP